MPSVDWHWSADWVRLGLVAAFRAFPDSPVISRPNGDVMTIRGDVPPEFDFIRLSFDCLGRDATVAARRKRLMLLTWARVTAMVGESGRDASMRERCRQEGWSWSSFQRGHRQGADEIATVMEIVTSVLKSLN